MSRAGYSDDNDEWAMIRWRGQVASATRGKRGQKMLSDLLAAIDAMPQKALITHELETFNPESGRLDVCALGALGHARGIDMAKIDPEEPDDVAAAFDIASPLAREIVYMNDEYFDYEYIGNQRVEITPEKRWEKMRAWVANQIRPSV
jgi:hypothetical protein